MSVGEIEGSVDFPGKWYAWNAISYAPNASPVA